MNSDKQILNERELHVLSFTETMEILLRYAIPVAKGEIAVSSEDAIRIAKRMGYPVVVKAISQKVSHKSEANALRLGIETDDDLVRAYQEVIHDLRAYDPKADITGVLVQEMIKDGTEVIVGISKDPQFGLVILFGLGGTLVEVLRDVSLRVAPITRYDAEEMIGEINGYKILEGFRGKQGADLGAIIDILLKVSKLSIEMKESVEELDLNPVIVKSEGRGAKVVDARFVSSKATLH